MLPGNTVGSLTAIQHDILVGSLLGDGTLRKQGARLNALFEVNHAEHVRAYVDWKWRHFQEYVRTPPKPRQGNGNRVAYRFTTRSLPVFTDYYYWFYRDRKKFVPTDLVLTPIALAVWFMDDGSKSRTASYLNTQQFSEHEQVHLASLLAKNFGIQSTLNRDKQYFRLRITTEGTKVLNNVIRLYVLPCYRYKLLFDPVTTDPKGKVQHMLDKTPTLVISYRDYAPNVLRSGTS